ncbi:MAG: glucose-6-phosphate dehydrogenase [Terriglobia bacterium]
MSGATANTRVQPAATRPAWTPRPDPCGLVIFGASGDLTARKLVPALYDLACAGHLPENFYVLGTARRDLGDQKFRQQMHAGARQHSRFLPFDTARWNTFAPHLHYQALDASRPESHQQLRRRLEELDRNNAVPGNHLFYLSVAPQLYAPITENLGGAGLVTPSADATPWTRAIIEKPFGHDTDSALALNRIVQSVLREPQVYRIDHYLGKETVQNLLLFRLANGIFEPVWNRAFIDHVQITVAEELGIEHRAGFYETAGAVRDMIQNHLLQILCLVAMEPPSSFESAPVQAEKVKILQSIRPLKPTDTVRGQYGPGQVNSKKVAGYRDEPGVDARSPTETYAAFKFEIDSWRWAGVPFYLRTGKRLPRKSSQVTIQFRDAPLQLFACTALQPCEPNLLTLRLQPDEGIGLRFIAKQPGLEVIGHSVQMDYQYGSALETHGPTAYETLLLDSMEGDRMLFARGDWIEYSWRLLTPLLRAWAGEAPKNFPNYAAGSWGPKEADALLARDHRRWHLR